MLPFLTVPISLPGDEEKGNKDKEVPCKLAPASILAYHPGYHWGTFIYLQTGQAFCCTLTVEQLEAMLIEYWKQVANISRKSNHLKLV